MYKYRTNAKMTTIRFKIINKIANKIVEQTLKRFQIYKNDNFDFEKFQLTIFETLIKELIIVIDIYDSTAIIVLIKDF